ncbi:N-acetylglucosamine-6-phosphate deacetylase [Halosimplex halophilum]|uniref:N-acetylglucosamine-6-phosphate deacetylase n=1 Tax=Halosimplex halophilum TaxID=2559572 RepID=UPI00107F3A69|nr:N-acetylglucosamine-6-phosphate deacetylase [Halosimplex halophilum]
MNGTVDVHVGTILSPADRYRDAVLSVVDGEIVDIGPPEGASPDLSFPDGTAIPGLVDAHTHGYGGHSVTSGDPADILGMAESVTAHGVTAVAPTTMSATRGRLLEVAGAFADAKAATSEGAALTGLHLEGPYFADSRQSGAQDPSTFRTPDTDELDKLVERSDGGVARITMAPEVDGALKFVREARRRGIAVSVGHTDADYERVRAAFDSGVAAVTHLYNGMAQFHHRDPGPVGAALVTDGVSVELIADGVHLHPAALELAIRAKGVESVVLVSDSAPCGGCPDGEYDCAGHRVLVSDDACRTVDGGDLVGSAVTLDEAIRTLVGELGVDLADAVRMAATNPARELSLDDRGRLTEGYRGDITVLDRDLRVVATVVAGTVRYRR